MLEPRIIEADCPPRTTERNRPRGITLHHSATENRGLQPSPAFAVARAESLRRRIRGDHRDNGWLDVGYNFLVSRDGIVMEGRSGSLDAAREGLVLRGAHAGENDANRYRWGICLEGNAAEPDWTLPSVQRAALVQLLTWLCEVGQVQSAEIDGHRDHVPTLCPGGGVYRLLPAFRREVHIALVEYRDSLKKGGPTNALSK